MYTPKIREVIRKKFTADQEEANRIKDSSTGFSLIYSDQPYLNFNNNDDSLDSSLFKLGYKKSRAEKEIGHHLPDTDFVEGKAKPTSSNYTMYINKDTGNIILREKGWIHYASGSCGYKKWDTFTVYKI